MLQHACWCPPGPGSPTSSSADLLSVHSSAFSRLLIKMLNKICLRLDPRSTLLLTSIQVEKEPLATILRAQSSKHLFLPTSSYPEYNYTVEDGVKSLAEVQVNDMHCCALIHRSHHSIVEGNQVYHACFTFGKFTLNVPNHVLLLHVPRNMFQKNSLHEHHKGPLSLQAL